MVSKIGCARTISTAVLVCEYLRAKCVHPQSKVHPDSIAYQFTNPTPENGYWSADIVVKQDMEYDTSKELVNICRAFVAGRGEIW